MNEDVPYQRCALMLVISGMVTAAPAVWVALELWTRPQRSAEAGVPAWVHLLILAGLTQLVYAAFVVQLKHPVALRATSVVCLVLGAAAAMCLGGAVFGGASGWTAQWLQIRDPLWASKGPHLGFAAVWCLIVVTLQTGLSVWSATAAVVARR